MKDLFGKAILDYQTDNHHEPLITETSLSEPEELRLEYLFRRYADMPKLEKKALQLCQGKVLDVGCGAGSHSLYLQNSGYDVTAIDISENAVKACRLRGLKHVQTADIFTFSGNYDTILLLMNGTGLCGRLKRLPEFLEKLKSLLQPDGQILIDSSDLIYLFEEDEDGGLWVPGDRYYGEVDYSVSYKGETEHLSWLYVDFPLLKTYATEAGLMCEKIADGKHYDYLARLTQ